MNEMYINELFPGSIAKNLFCKKRQNKCVPDTRKKEFIDVHRFIVSHKPYVLMNQMYIDVILLSVRRFFCPVKMEGMENIK